MSVVDLRSDYHGHVVDFAGDLDRRYFAAHPGVASYVRPALAHEFCDIVNRGVPDICVDLAGVAVEVVQVAVGIRSRRPLWDGMVLPVIPARSA